MGSLDSGMSEHDIGAITSEVEGFQDGRGWNVFHYAAHHQSQPIMERLVKYLKGIEYYNFLKLGKTYTKLNLDYLHAVPDLRLVLFPSCIIDIYIPP